MFRWNKEGVEIEKREQTALFAFLFNSSFIQTYSLNPFGDFIFWMHASKNVSRDFIFLLIYRLAVARVAKVSSPI